MVRSTRSRAAAVKPPLAPVASRTRVAIVEPVPRAPSTRSATRPQAALAPIVKDQSVADAIAPRTRSNIKHSAAPPAGRGRNTLKSHGVKAPEQTACPTSSTSSEEQEMVEVPETNAPAPDSAPASDPVPLPTQGPTPTLSSFAPQGFVFQPPTGLFSFQPAPLTPRSADAFLKPSCSYSFPPVPLFPCDELEPEAELTILAPPKSPIRSPSHPSPILAPASPACPQEPQHDVEYFRSEMVTETERLSGQCAQWEPRVDDPSIPEEMRDSMRTVVGQARLLMKERFGQFRGLVDDCELGRGEKITTCTDLQGFWEMIYYQVEDVNKKFGALSEAESRGWQEECRPPPRQKRVPKKQPPSAASKPSGGPGTNAAAKSRLAAIKAAMKAKQQATEAKKAAQVEAEGTVQATGSAVDNPAPEPQDLQSQNQAQTPETLVFNGGFFQVESPAKPTGSVRRSSRLSGAVPAQPSPYPGSRLSTPARSRPSNAASHAASPLALRLTHTPGHLTPACTPAGFKPAIACTPLPPQSHAYTPQSSVRDPAKVSVCFSPVKDTHVETNSQSDIVSRQDEDTLDQPESERMQEHVACDQSVNIEASDHSSQPQLSIDVPPQIFNIQSVLATGEPTESDSPVSTLSLPSTPAHQGRGPSLEACDDNLSLTTSLYPSLPLSPPDIPLSPPSHRLDSPTKSPALSFNLSPCPPHTTPARVKGIPSPLSFPSLMSTSPPAILLSSPALLHSPGVCDSSLTDTNVHTSVRADTSISEGFQGLDFERYLQPAARCSLSPQTTVATAMSPAAVDVEMESPVAEPGDKTQEDAMTPTAFPRVAQLFTPRTPQAAESDLLFFSPNPRDRIRQSVCPSDLMVFTPPNNR